MAKIKHPASLMRHDEKHFAATETVRDVVIGMADGLTVPFALAAGLAGAVDSTHLIVVAGLAEITAGAIAMGLGGYLAARTDAEHYDSERAREDYEVDNMEREEREETAAIFAKYGLKGEPLQNVVNAIASDKEQWIEFMMQHELGLEKPNPRRAPISALTIGGSYIVGGFIPLMAYMLVSDPHDGLLLSAALTGVALLIFGGIKAKLTSVPILRGAFQTLLVGGAAAGAAYVVAKLVG